tara:strand:- start:1975 stop:3042 length:1068 start_codon:yes stop_codon:yes gene_type:complete
MAYTFFPKSVSELTVGLEKNRFPSDNISEIVSLYTLLAKTTDTPINIDFGQKSNVNVTRMLSEDITVAKIKRDANLKKIKIKFGNGSSGNRGVNNRGNLFEPQFADALLKWWGGDDGSDQKMLAAIEDLNKTYDIRKSKTLKVDVVGGENTPRPIKYAPSIQVSNPKGAGTDVGKSVTDITLTLDGGKEIYLSLKLGTTTTFFNLGIKKVLTKKEIQDGSVSNREGKQLLDMFGIDNELFCSIFNGDLDKGVIKDAKLPNKRQLEVFLASGVGHNYHIIHKLSGTIKSKEMSERAMKEASTLVGVPKIYYGGKTGKGKRIDIEFYTQTYQFKINIRDTQGTDGYPTRLMGDFKYR